MLYGFHPLEGLCGPLVCTELISKYALLFHPSAVLTLQDAGTGKTETPPTSANTPLVDHSRSSPADLKSKADLGPIFALMDAGIFVPDVVDKSPAAQVACADCSCANRF